MSVDINRVVLVGNISNMTAVTCGPSGVSRCVVTLGTVRSWECQDSQKKSWTEYHSVVLFGIWAEIVGGCSVGTRISVQGELRYNKRSEKSETQIVVNSPDGLLVVLEHSKQV